MKRVLLLLITIAVFLTTFHLFVFPALAQYEHRLILDMDAKVVVNLIRASEMCGGTISLHSPTQKELLSFPASAENLTAEVGTFAKGTAVILSFTPEPNTPCPEQTFLSGDPNHFLVIKVTQVYWYAEWEIPGTPTGFNLRFYLTPAEISKHHPVIFIHGLGGYPTDWTTGDKKVYFDTLRAEPYNYPEDYLHAYEYADIDGNPETYDNQGDVTLISQGLEDEVNRLAELYSPGCSKDCVDVVGFSLGGIIARDYLNNHPTNHKVRKLITIGSPHLGVDWLRPEAWFAKIPIAGTFMQKAFNQFIETTFLLPFKLFAETPIDLNSIAVQQVVPGNPFLNLLNNLLTNPIDLSYSTLYGNIDVSLRQKIFFFELKKDLSIGDGIVFKDSATGIPVEGKDEVGFSDPDLLVGYIKPVKTKSGYEYQIDAPTINEFRFWHGKLITQPEVVSRVVDLLTEN